MHFAAGATFFAALPLLIDAFSLYKSYFLYFYFFLGRIWSSFVRSVRLDQLKIVPQFIQHNKGSTEKNPFFLGISPKQGGGRYSSFLCEILVAIVFGHEIQIFIPKFGQNSNFYS